MNRLPLLLVLTAFVVSAAGCASPLHYYSQKGDVDEATRLIAQGADINETDYVGMTPLMYAAYHGRLNMVVALLDHGADVNKGSGLHGSPLSQAAGQGHTRVVALLLERGANVNAENAMGQTPLEIAAYYEHAVLVKMLLDKGADADAAISKLSFMSTGEKNARAVALIKSYLTAQGTMSPPYSQEGTPSSYSEGGLPPANSEKPMQTPYSF